ncbi:MAG: hypothetical protein ACREPG_13575, partial [Candidatus Binatia bacterium]
MYSSLSDGRYPLGSFTSSRLITLRTAPGAGFEVGLVVAFLVSVGFRSGRGRAAGSAGALTGAMSLDALAFGVGAALATFMGIGLLDALLATFGAGRFAALGAGLVLTATDFFLVTAFGAFATGFFLVVLALTFFLLAGAPRGICFFLGTA